MSPPAQGRKLPDRKWRRPRELIYGVFPMVEVETGRRLSKTGASGMLLPTRGPGEAQLGFSMFKNKRVRIHAHNRARRQRSKMGLLWLEIILFV